MKLRGIGGLLQAGARPAGARPAGVLRRISMFRLTITLIIVGTAVLSFTLQSGLFRFMFRGALILGAVLLLASYVLERWIKYRLRRRDSDTGRAG